MEYSVKLTPHAIVQIQETIAYISKVLPVPETARAWSDYLQKEIAGLSTMPARFSAVDEEPWRSRGYRKMLVKNFIVYYYADDETKTVWVTAVVYGRRDQLNVLKDMP
ncbi:MAG: type II toxin-antitoxin system RelE/ParE family toxin [Clostridia bacterium]|nr:type II toxin-antitoxin system RelE/ParE family toxin [Clostridia bacterium]